MSGIRSRVTAYVRCTQENLGSQSKTPNFLGQIDNTFIDHNKHIQKEANELDSYWITRILRPYFIKHPKSTIIKILTKYDS